VIVLKCAISDSCGYGVPFMNFEAHRPTMDQWAKRKGLQGIRDLLGREESPKHR